MLDEINDFRNAANVSSATLVSTPEYQTYMDQRATEKAKQLADTGTFNHSGQTLQDKFSNIHAGENIGAVDVNAGDSLDEQVNQFIAYQKSADQAEKDDYEAINIRHERTNITNPSGTVGHYTNIIIPAATKVVIGIGTYTKNGITYVAAVTSHITSVVLILINPLFVGYFEVSPCINS